MGADAGLRNTVAIVLIGLTLAACSGISGPRGGYEAGGFGRSRGYYKVGAPYQVNGVWYYPHVDFAYDETGTASWYGEAFNGRSTANGEVFDLNQVSAAHKTLQLPSIVEVTNLQNGRALKVRVNDRGPYVGDRIIDLSRRAAQLLGFERSGMAPVRVRILKEESIRVAEAAMHGDVGATRFAAVAPTVQTRSAAAPRPAPRTGAAPARTATVIAAAVPPRPVLPAAPPEPSAPAPVIMRIPVEATQVAAAAVAQPMPEEAGRRSVWPSLIPSAHAATYETASPHRRQMRAASVSGRIFVQVGAFALAENAHRIRARLASLSNVEVARLSTDGAELYRVRLGPLASETEARRLLGKVAEYGIRDARIVEE